MRKKLIENLSQWSRKQIKTPQLIKGPRQVGKSNLLKKFGEANFTDCHFFDLETQTKTIGQIFDQNLPPQALLNKLSLANKKNIHPDTSILIFNEIQAISRAERAITQLHNTLPQLAIVASCSTFGSLHDKWVLPTTEKSNVLTLRPLNFMEFLVEIGEKNIANTLKRHKQKQTNQSIHEKSIDLFKTYIVTGGLPEIVSIYANEKNQPTVAFQKIRNRQHQILMQYENDFIKYSGKTNTQHISKIFQAISKNLHGTNRNSSAQLFSFKDVVSSGYRSYKALSPAISWLSDSSFGTIVPHVTNASPPLQNHLKENRFKFFLFDTGLLGAMCEIRPEDLLLTPIEKWDNFILENFVLQEMNAYNISKVATWSGRTSKVELLIENDDTIIPIEVKTTLNKSAKSLRAFDKKYNPPYCIRLNGQTPSFSEQSNHVSYPIYLTSFFSNLPNNAIKLPLYPEKQEPSPPATTPSKPVSDQEPTKKTNPIEPFATRKQKKEDNVSPGKGKQLSLFG